MIVETHNNPRLDWDEYFMTMAFLASLRSKDPNSQVGACIVNNNNRVVGLGYNGFPNRCSDSDLPWSREGSFLETKYAFVVHAESNAILNSNANTQGSRIYCTLYPCNECAKQIIQAGITEVIYYDDKYIDKDFSIAATKMFNLAKVKTTKFNSLITLAVKIERY